MPPQAHLRCDRAPLLHGLPRTIHRRRVTGMVAHEPSGGRGSDWPIVVVELPVDVDSFPIGRLHHPDDLRQRVGECPVACLALLDRALGRDAVRDVGKGSHHPAIRQRRGAHFQGDAVRPVPFMGRWLLLQATRLAPMLRRLEGVRELATGHLKAPDRVERRAVPEHIVG